MRITQAHVSKSVADFPFLESLNLIPYYDSSAPCLFVGCYSQEDFNVIIAHTGKAVILWCGQDANDMIMKGWHAALKNCMHVTWLVNVEKALRNFLDVRLVSPILLGGNFYPSTFGKKIFAYCPASAPQYHRSDLICELQEYYQNKFEFVIGGGSVPQTMWLNRVGNVVYDDCFIGLCLSGFAGGGQTVIQMGLKGRMVVTNVVDTPNVYNWNSLEDVKNAIDREARMIGKEGIGLAKLVAAHVNKNPLWLEV